VISDNRQSPAQTVSHSIIVGVGCKRPCDFSGHVEIVEPTTGRVTGRLPVCKTCGSISSLPTEQLTAYQRPEGQ
jgi:hypothetical protein